jgi:gag-polyprotein putative aspartyl protease
VPRRIYQLWNTFVRLVSVIALTAVFARGMSPEARAGCRLEKVAELHVQMVGNSPIIDGQINGQPIRSLLETGANSTFITLTAARRLALPIREYSSRTVYGVGGNQSVRTTNVKELHIGSFLLKNVTINVVGNEIHDGNGVASVQLGSDFLSGYATEFDFSHDVVRFLHPQDCKIGQLAYWSPTFAQVDLQPSFIVDIKVNDKPQHARLVSGSGRSYISLDAAKEGGVEPTSLGVEPAEPFVASPASAIPTWIGRFNTVEIGQETMKNVRLNIGDVFPSGTQEFTGSHLPAQIKTPYQVKLGSDFFQAHRIIVTPDEHVALFTYNEGAVF